MLRSEKESAVMELQERFGRMSSAVFLDYAGMTVEEVSQLRNTFREKGVEYKVVKNTLVKKALSEHAWAEGLSDALRGMTDKVNDRVFVQDLYNILLWNGDFVGHKEGLSQITAKCPARLSYHRTKPCQ